MRDILLHRKGYIQHTKRLLRYCLNVRAINVLQRLIPPDAHTVGQCIQQAMCRTDKHCECLGAKILFFLPSSWHLAENTGIENHVKMNILEHKSHGVLLYKANIVSIALFI